MIQYHFIDIISFRQQYGGNHHDRSSEEEAERVNYFYRIFFNHLRFVANIVANCIGLVSPNGFDTPGRNVLHRDKLLKFQKAALAHKLRTQMQRVLRKTAEQLKEEERQKHEEHEKERRVSVLCFFWI